MNNNLNTQLTTSLEDLAYQQVSQISDELKPSWNLLCKGIEYHILDAEALSELASYLDIKSDYIVDELAFEFIDESLRVKFLDDEIYCEPELMISEIKKLLTQ